ncbi:MAG: CDP-alcohol phosphatidyltransferase family protein [Phycisphaerales bacterium]
MPGLRRAIPNALTLARVVLAAAMFGILSLWSITRSPITQPSPALDWVLLLAAFLFILAAITDALDGHLARRWRVISVFGRIMDPFADKLLVIGSFILLAGPGFHLPEGQASGVLPWMAAVVLARELLVTSIRGVLESRGVDFSATASGKLKMILQSMAIPVVLVLLALRPSLDPGVARLVPRINFWIMLVTVATTALSGVPYVLRAARWASTTTKEPR